MAEFLCKGYKCECGQLVKVAQLDKTKPLPAPPEGQRSLGGIVTCPRCHKDTFLRPDALMEWTERETVQ
jgi:hypothetical protein